MRLTGFAGVGKSALARNTINYVQERTMLEGGCIYVNGRSISEFTIFIKKLIERIEQDSSGWISIRGGQVYETLNSDNANSHRSFLSLEEYFFATLI